MTLHQIHLLINWYVANARDLPWRRTRDPYHIWVSEIMCQQTRVEAVKGYYARFLQALPTIETLAQADDEKLMKLWEGLGYYSRARNLKKAAQVVMQMHGGKLPNTVPGLLGLPGIGQYTAGAIASIAFDIPAPAVDGNVLRVFARLKADYDDITLDRTKKVFSAQLLQAIPHNQPGRFNQALMELGALVCLPNGVPLCSKCPLQDSCLANKHNLINDLPVKTAKKPRRIEQKQLLILRYKDKLALRKRPKTGLLADLWEIPEAFEIAPQLIISDEPIGTAVHIFTHIEWHMAARKIFLRKKIGLEGVAWVTQQELEQSYALPSAFAGFRDKMFSQESVDNLI